MKIKHVVIAALLLAGGIYLYRRNNETTSEESQKSDFLGFNRKGSQKWADKLAKRWCVLKRFIDSMESNRPSVSMSGYGNLAALNRAKVESNSIMNQLLAYGYSIVECRAVKEGNRQVIDITRRRCYDSNGHVIYINGPCPEVR